MPSSATNGNTFYPTQYTPNTPEILCELCHPATAEVAKYFLASITDGQKSPAESWTVHDNACGYGEVTRMLLEMETAPANKMAIVGTDSSEAMIGAYLKLKEKFAARLEGGDAPVSLRAEVQRSESLTALADNSFDYSFTNFLIHSGPDPSLSARLVQEVHRTLKTGGTAVITNWSQVGHADAIVAAHEGTRGAGASPLLFGMGKEFLKPERLVSSVVEGGFDEAKLKVLSKVVSAGSPWKTREDKRHYCNLMWSVLGSTVHGWSPEDEKKWEQALDILEETLPKLSGITVSEKGYLDLTLTSTIVVVQK